MNKTYKKLVLFLFVIISFVLLLPHKTYGKDSAKKPVDLVFVIDSTGSMEDNIENVRNNLADFMDVIESEGIDLHIGFIEYKDRIDDGDEYGSPKILSGGNIKEDEKPIPWCTTSNEGKEKLNEIINNVGGGGDDPETVFDAVVYLTEDYMDWRDNATRFAVVLTDASYKIDTKFASLYSNIDNVVSDLTARSERKITISVVTSEDYKSGSDGYEKLYSSTGGIWADINSSDFSKELLNLADTLTTLVDSDGDCLPDEWEKNGVDVENGAGEKVHIPLNKMGADVNIRDIFVECDWMVRPESGFWFNHKEKVSFNPNDLWDGSMKVVYDSFKKHKINIHIDAGPDSIDYVTGKKWSDYPENGGDKKGGSGASNIEYKPEINVTNNNYDEWTNLINKNFGKSRQRIFRYCIFADSYTNENGSGSSGLTINTPSQCFIVTLGGYYGKNFSTITENAVAGTFMHELGHSLGLKHGGCDDLNGKPNYLSIMNYNYQMTGLLGTNSIDYSNYKLDDLNTSALSEGRGLDNPEKEALTKGTGLRARWYWDNCTKDKKYEFPKSIANEPIDWNQDIDTDDENVSVRFCDAEGKEITDEDKEGKLIEYPILKGFNDWDNLKFTGGTIGAGESAKLNLDISEKPQRELTYDQAKKLCLLGNPGTGTISIPEQEIFLANRSGQKLYLNINNLGDVDSKFSISISSKLLKVGFKKTINVSAATSDGAGVQMIELPVVSSPQKGTYTIKCILKSKEHDDFVKEYKVNVIESTKEQIAQIKKAIKDGTLTDNSESNQNRIILNKVINQYKGTLDKKPQKKATKVTHYNKVIKKSNNDIVIVLLLLLFLFAGVSVTVVAVVEWKKNGK
ncbi:MAG: VWA domain-containing protein [Lachnospiraceae bacterium]|jgi:hypothetical protein|nr:VWA domain-containing protein [Lachnospiraceae bacterium]